MRNIFLVFLIVLILISSSIGAVAPQINDAEYENLKIKFLKPTIKDETKYITIELNEANSFIMEPNKPKLPSYKYTFTFPFGTKINSVKCAPNNIQNKMIDKEIKLVSEPIVVGTTTKTIDKNIIPTLTEPYPKNWYDYNIGTGLHNNDRVVFVTVDAYPIKYIPAESAIEWASEIEIIVEYEEPEPTSTNDEYQFLILSADNYYMDLGTFQARKAGYGVASKRVTLGEIYGGDYFPVQGRDDPEKIKYFIKNAIEEWGTTYVMIVGGSDEFPTRQTHVEYKDDKELFVTDLYYADIYDGSGGFSSWDTNDNDVFGEYDWGSSNEKDDVDLYPDVYIGRIPVISGSELNTCLNKFELYENSKAYTQDWFSNIILIGGDTFNYNDDPTPEGEFVNAAVEQIMAGFVPTKIWATNGQLTAPNGVTIMTNTISQGAGFIDFSGHGNPRVWATHPFQNDNLWIPLPEGNYKNTRVGELTNGDKLPIVVTGACSVSKYNANDNCFSYSFLRNPNGGSIANFGATGLGWVYIGEDVIEGLVEGMALNVFEAYAEGANTLGEMWGTAINEYIFSRMRAVDFKTIEEWHLFGDPTLAVREVSQKPSTPSKPQGPTEGQYGTEYTYTTNTTDPDNDDVYYFFDWGDGSYSGWVGKFGSGEIGRASHTWSSEGSFSIRVRAKDIHGVQSDWSDPLSVSMPRNRNIDNPVLTKLFEILQNAFPRLSNFFNLLI
jgi:hypothetical protein